MANCVISADTILLPSNFAGTACKIWLPANCAISDCTISAPVARAARTQLLLCLFVGGRCGTHGTGGMVGTGNLLAGAGLGVNAWTGELPSLSSSEYIPKIEAQE